ncbi:DNA-binding Lrp family transcriptional regulator [Streptomonospora nanhaiensis]|uniref:DNA-binding Lrp family transcriptional regulator n=1 Tax=Streptomonospora nanhaiensis TaxID=1323731 RepID=A0A853BKF8_9ACTN|nr:Lrp/AsnC family transcriptional regulator [Streptomonospora nanhaiensis]NYI95510.1 DNA-binding Lrp family transcriptional regulator [Streptomonospora nanhaiensis]
MADGQWQDTDRREGAAEAERRRPPRFAAGGDDPDRPRARGARLPDAVDEIIIGALAEDARTGITEIAAMANVSRATAYNRIKRLTDEGVIRGYSVVTDHARMGLGVTALVLISGSQPDWRANREILSSYPEIEYCWYVVGSADIVLLVRVADTNQLRDLILTRLQALPGVTATQTLTVIDEVVHRPVVRPAN